MTIYLAGTGPHIVTLPLPPGVSLQSTGGGTTSAGEFDSNWVSSGIGVTTSNFSGNIIPLSGAPTSGWIHDEIWQPFSGTGGTTGTATLAAYNSAGTMVLKLVRISSVTPSMGVQYWNGSTFVTIAEVSFIAGRYQWDIFFDFSASGRIEFYQDKILIGTVTGDFSALVDVAGLGVGGVYSVSNARSCHSQLLVADFPTLFAKVKQTVLNVAGAVSDWTGSVADIDETLPTSTDYINTDTAGDISTFKAAARTGLDDFTVKAVFLQWSGLRAGATAPTQITPLARIGGVNYEVAPQSLGFGLQSFHHQFATDPSTSSAWVTANAVDANLEFGFKATA